MRIFANEDPSKISLLQIKKPIKIPRYLSCFFHFSFNKTNFMNPFKTNEIISQKLEVRARPIGYILSEGSRFRRSASFFNNFFKYVPYKGP